MSRFAKWAQTERSEGARIVAMILAGLVFLGAIPALILAASPRIDRLLHLNALRPGPASIALGGVLVAAGLALGLWSNYVQLTLGRGTPIPLIPTKQLLTSGPYRYCRNPMTLGAILAYLGLSIAAVTPTGLASVIIFATALLTYLKRIEEDELRERFGEAYEAYKRDVPFILPRIPRSR